MLLSTRGKSEASSQEDHKVRKVQAGITIMDCRLAVLFVVGRFIIFLLVFVLLFD